MIERENILPLFLGAALALAIHLTALPGAVMIWRNRPGSEPPPGPSRRVGQTEITSPCSQAPFTGSVPDRSALQPQSRPPADDFPRHSKDLAPRFPRIRTPTLEPVEPPQVRLGRDDADPAYRVGWISYDDFKKLVAPVGQTEQPALQSRMEPQPDAPLRGDPALPPSLASETIPPARPTAQSPISSSLQPPAPSAAPLSQAVVRTSGPSTGQTIERLSGGEATAATMHALPQAIEPPNEPRETIAAEPSPGATDPDQGIDALSLAPQDLSALAGQAAEVALQDPNLLLPRRIPPPTRQEDLPANQSPSSSPGAFPAGSPDSPDSLTLAHASVPDSYPALPLVPDLRMEVRPGTMSPAAGSAGPEQARSTHAWGAAGQDPTRRPSSAPRSDRESSPVSLTDRPVNVRLQPGAVLVGKGVEIKTAMPRLSTVARFVIPHNARAKLTFDRSGQVVHARFLQSTGFETWDGPILASLYLWRASGRLFEEHPGPFELEINLLFVRE